MNTVAERAEAKLNLSLDVLGKRPDGYHEMKMLMQSVSLCDEVTVKVRPQGGYVCESNFGFLPTDDDNLAVRAARRFFAARGTPDWGAEIQLQKRIPVGAGMAGGSSNAAAVLRALNRLCGSPFSLPELETIGAQVGSDVPYCVRGGTRLATGHGEILAQAPPLPACGVAICKPDFSIRTPQLFARIDARRSATHPDTEGLWNAMAAGDLRGAALRMYNVFEDVLPPRCGEIFELKTELLSLGALGAVMTGTGSAVFGIFPDLAAAQAAADALKSDVRECFSAVPTGMAGAEGMEASDLRIE